jgi:hypothetical protein
VTPVKGSSAVRPRLKDRHKDPGHCLPDYAHRGLRIRDRRSVVSYGADGKHLRHCGDNTIRCPLHSQNQMSWHLTPFGDPHESTFRKASIERDESTRWARKWMSLLQRSNRWFGPGADFVVGHGTRHIAPSPRSLRGEGRGEGQPHAQSEIGAKTSEINVSNPAIRKFDFSTRPCYQQRQFSLNK